MLCSRAPNAKSITFGTHASRGPVDIEDRQEPDASGEMRLVRSTVATIPAADLSTLTVHSSITIGSTGYVVRDIQLVEDGLLKELICAES